MSAFQARVGWVLIMSAVLLSQGCRTGTVAVAALNPQDREIELYLDSIVRAPRGGFLCWDGGSEEPVAASDIEVLRAGMLSWRFDHHRTGDVVMDLAFAAAIIRNRGNGDEWLLLMNLISLHEVGASQRSWMVTNKPFGPAIDCVSVPSRPVDRARVPDTWSAFEGGIGVSSGVNRDAWLAYLGIAPPFKSSDYREFDPDFSHP